MLLIKTYLGPSSIHGIGCFAAESVSVGEMIWSFNANFSHEISLKDLENGAYPEAVRTLIEAYAWNFDGEKDSVFLDIDNARFMNHSPNANTAWLDLPNRIGYGFAAANLEPGDEITVNYGDEGFCRQSLERSIAEHGDAQ